MNKLQKEIYKEILQNQISIMIWINGLKNDEPYYNGYFKYNVERAEELIDKLVEEQSSGELATK